MLTRGERWVRCLTGEQIDRVPFGNGLGWYTWGETHEKWKKELNDPNLDYGHLLKYEDPHCSNPPDIEYLLFPGFERQVLGEDERTVTVRESNGVVYRYSKAGSTIPEQVECPVTDRYSWDKLKAERLQPDPGRIRTNWADFRAAIQRGGLVVQMGNFPFGVFGTPRELLGVEALLMAFYDHPDMMKDMMQHLTGLWVWLYEQAAKEVQIDHIHIWEDMSGRQGSLISPAMIEEFMMPCYDMVWDFARRHKVRVISMDSDGDVSDLARIMTKRGVNVMFPFEVQAGCDILEYRKQYPELGIMGGLDKRVLALGKAECDREIERCAKMLEHGRYIPSFDHLIPPEAKWENLVYVAERIGKLCHAARNP